MEDLQYWVIGWTLALCAVALFLVMTPLYVARFVGDGKRPPIIRGKVSATGLSLIDVLGVGIFFGLYGGMWLANETMTPPEDLEITPVLLMGQLLFQAFMVFLVAALLFWRVNLVDFFQLNWKQWWLAPVIGVGVVLVMVAVGAVMTLFSYEQWMADLQQVEGSEDTQQDVVKMIKEATDPVVFFMLALVACVGAPISEEVVFRGYIYPVVKRFSNIPVAIVFTGLLFAAIHGNLAALLPLFILGMLLAAVYEWTGSLWTPIAVHAIFNSMQVGLMKLMQLYPEKFEELEKAGKAKEAALIVLGI
jgi:membrane protease YdiL (CAAX protease family)